MSDWPAGLGRGLCGGAGARNRRTLLVARGADNFWSGLFLPLALVYVTAMSARRRPPPGCWSGSARCGPGRAPVPGMLIVVRRVELSGPVGVRWVPDEHRGVGVLVLAGSSGRID